MQSFLEHVHFTTKDERTETKAADSPSSPTRAPTFALRDADFAVEVETLSSHFQRTLLDPQVGFLVRSKNSSKNCVSHGFHSIFFHFLWCLSSFPSFSSAFLLNFTTWLAVFGGAEQTGMAPSLSNDPASFPVFKHPGLQGGSPEAQDEHASRIADRNCRGFSSLNPANIESIMAWCNAFHALEILKDLLSNEAIAVSDEELEVLSFGNSGMVKKV